MLLPSIVSRETLTQRFQECERWYLQNETFSTGENDWATSSHKIWIKSKPIDGGGKSEYELEDEFHVDIFSWCSKVRNHMCDLNMG